MMMMVTVLLVSLTVALPSVYVEGQREREEELIFRGNEYARAIALFHRRFNRFPVSVNELLRTNGIRFLRHAYPDPMSRTGNWRFIHANINGTLLDSKTTNNLLPAALANQQNPVATSKEQSSANGPQAGTSPFFGGGKEIQGAFIAGVASSSSRESIRVLNHRRHYDEWEFLGVEGNPAGVVGPPAQPAGPAQPATPAPPATPASPGPQFPSMPPLTDQPVPPQ
jgi:hypothetical protein